MTPMKSFRRLALLPAVLACCLPLPAAAEIGVEHLHLRLPHARLDRVLGRRGLDQRRDFVAGRVAYLDLAGLGRAPLFRRLAGGEREGRGCEEEGGAHLVFPGRGRSPLHARKACALAIAALCAARRRPHIPAMPIQIRTTLDEPDTGQSFVPHRPNRPEKVEG